MKSPIISISSSSDDDEENLDDDDDDEEVEEQESEFASEDEGDDSESDDQEYDENEEDDVESDYEGCSDDDDELCDRVICLDQGKNDLQELSLSECKAYLRKHRLRVSGTKEECIQRIKEHWRLKGGRGEALYPRSSFSINCTGDACKGDVVLFVQRVYKKFDKVTRTGSLLGQRSVAGRIVKESYGTEKQQHTFTVEVLWSKGFKKLPPLSTLLVKGRNLYRFKTFRQPWKSEAERLKVLREKHERGTAARHKRTMMKIKIASSKDEGTKHQKPSHKRPSRTKRPTGIDKQNSTKRRGAAPVRNASTTACKRKAVQFEKTELRRVMQPTFHSIPYPLYSHRSNLQEASSSLPYNGIFSPFVQHLPPSLPPHRFPGYSHYNNGPLRPNQPPVFNHYRYEQPVSTKRPRWTNT